METETPSKGSTTFSRLREEERKIRVEVQERMIGYIAAALGLVAGLAWNNAITAAIKEYFPSTGSGVLAQFIYAVILTIFVAVLAFYLSKFVSKKIQ